MTSKFSRFMNLERSRGERPKPEEPSQLQTGGRFEALAQRGESLQEAAVPETHLERFRGEAPLALAEVPAEAERFPRCARCESENGRFAKECTVCGADLNTPQQREYNERLWQTRQAQDREAAAVVAARAQAQQQSEAERREDQARYARMLEEQREEEREPFRQSVGWQLLKHIPFPAVRWAIMLGLSSIPIAIALQGGTRSARRLAAGVGVILVILFLAPAGFSKPGRRP